MSLALMVAGSRREALAVVLLCCAWYSLSSAASVAGKLALTAFARPATLAAAQLAAAALCSRAARCACAVRPQCPETRALLPLAGAKVLTTLLSGVALWKVPVSYAHTVKATTPLWTAALAFALWGERQSRAVLGALLLIAAGVGVASLTELAFDALGLGAALAAAALLALQHLYSKRMLGGSGASSGAHPLRLLERLSLLALVLFAPLWLWLEGAALLTGRRGDEPAGGWARWALLVGADGLLAWLQGVCALAVLRRVSPLTYGVASAAKRAVVVAASLAVLGNAAPPANVAGMALAALGVLAYNRAKRMPAHSPAHHQRPLLPV